jgi:hypothetical protein
LSFSFLEGKLFLRETGPDVVFKSFSPVGLILVRGVSPFSCSSDYSSRKLAAWSLFTGCIIFPSGYLV